MASTTDNFSADSSTTDAGTHGKIGSTLKNGVNNALTQSKETLDYALPPTTRARLQDRIKDFARRRPKLAAFVLSQVVFSGPPLSLFLVFALTVSVSSLLTGIVIGAIGSLLFVASCLGFVLIFLLPTLLATTFLAFAVWVGGGATYYVVNRYRARQIPGIHVPLVEGGLKERALAAGRKASNQIEGRNASQHSEKQHGNMDGHSNGVRAAETGLGGPQAGEKRHSALGSQHYQQGGAVRGDIKQGDMLKRAHEFNDDLEPYAAQTSLSTVPGTFPATGKAPSSVHQVQPRAGAGGIAL